MKLFAIVWDFGLNSFESSEASACGGVDPGGHIIGGVVVVTAKTDTRNKFYLYAYRSRSYPFSHLPLFRF